MPTEPIFYFFFGLLLPLIALRYMETDCYRNLINLFISSAKVMCWNACHKYLLSFVRFPSNLLLYSPEDFDISSASMIDVCSQFEPTVLPVCTDIDMRLLMLISNIGQIMFVGSRHKQEKRQMTTGTWAGYAAPFILLCRWILKSDRLIWLQSKPRVYTYVLML